MNIVLTRITYLNYDDINLFLDKSNFNNGAQYE